MFIKQPLSDPVMARRTLLVALIILSAVLCGSTAKDSNSLDEDAIVIEWFADNSDEASNDIEDNLTFLRQDSRVLWLSWHPGMLVENDPVGNHDGSVRAERMGVTELPAFRVELQNVQGVADGNKTGIEPLIEDYVNNTTVERLAEISLEIQITDNDTTDGIEELVVQATITPLTNFSDETVLYFMIVEWSHASDDSTHRPQNVVRELMPRSGIPRTAGDTGLVQFVFDSKYLDPANITIESENANRWAVVAMLSGHNIGSDSPRSAISGEDEIILGTAIASVPTKWQLTTIDDIIPWMIATIVIVAAMAMIVHAERRRERELPKVTGRLLHAPSSGNQRMYKVALDIVAGSLPAELLKVYSSPPWKIRRAPKRQILTSGSENSWELDVRAEEDVAHKSVDIHVSFTVESTGDGWVMDLRLKPPQDDEEE